MTTPVRTQPDGQDLFKISPETGAGARQGSHVLERLRMFPPSLRYAGKPIEDATAHPATRNGLQSLAALYDLQWTQPDTLLFDSPTNSLKVSRTFMIPRTVEELRSIGRALKVRADTNFGMMGRMPDYLNRTMMGYAGRRFFPRSTRILGIMRAGILSMCASTTWS